jgi:prepilin peptidase CpaA
LFATIAQYVLFAAFPLAMAYAAASDLLTMTISNKLALGMVGAFAVLAPVAGLSWEAVGLHVAAGAAVLAAGFVLFALGWIGGGDAKLAAAAGLWIGWTDLVEYLSLAAVFGGVLTVIIIVFRKSVLPAFVIRMPWVQRLHDEGAGVPYGVALAAAGLAIYPHTVWLNVAAG